MQDTKAKNNLSPRHHEEKKGHVSRGSIYAKITSKENVSIVDKQLGKYTLISELEKKTGLSKIKLMMIGISTILFVMIFGLGFQFLGHFIALVWPGYRSFLVIDALDQLVDVKEEDIHDLGRSKASLIEELERYNKLREQFNMKPINKSYDELTKSAEGIESFLEKEKKKLETRINEKATRYLMYWIVYGIFYLAEYVLAVFTFWIPFYWVIKFGFLYWCGSPKYHGAVLVYRNIFSPIMTKYQKTFEKWILVGKKMMMQTVDELKDDTAKVFEENKGMIMTGAVKIMGQVQAGLEKKET